MAAFVCGLIGFLFGFVPLLFFIAMPLGLLAFVFGIVARRRGRSGMAVAGVVLGALAVVLGIVGIAIINDAFEDLDEEIDKGRDEEQQREASDVTVASCGVGDLNFMEATVSVTNNSSERSNYFVDVVFESTDSSQQLATAPVVVNALEPGQTATDEASSFTEASSEFSCRVGDVERFSDE